MMSDLVGSGRASVDANTLLAALKFQLSDVKRLILHGETSLEHQEED